MASEVSRGLIRIGTNYGRLACSVVISLLLVPILLHSVQEDGLSLILLFGSTIGIASMFQEVIQRSMIRELGAALHSGGGNVFRRTYATAYVVSLIAMVLAIGVFAILYLCVPLLRVANLEAAAYSMVFWRGISTAVIIACSPAFNMLLVSERMIAYNGWMLIVQRAHSIIAAVIVTFIIPIDSPSEGVIAFAIISSGVQVVATILGAANMMLLDRRTTPTLRGVNTSDLRSIVHTTGWNSAVTVAMNMYLRLDAIIMNVAFGLFGNLTFGLAVLLTNYARRITTGMTDGLDAVSTRIDSGRDRSGIATLVRHSTRLHGLVALPAGLGIAILSEPILQLWVGSRTQNPEMTIPPTMIMIQIMMFGIVVRGISDCWVQILYGAGAIRHYAPLLVIGGILNPCIAIALIWLFPEGSTLELMGPAIATSAIFVAIQGFIFPSIVARVTGTSYTNIIAPLIRPAIASIAGAAPLLVVVLMIDAWGWMTFLLVCAGYGLVTLAFTWFIGFDTFDRSIAWNVLRRVMLRIKGQRDSVGEVSPPTEQTGLRR